MFRKCNAAADLTALSYRLGPIQLGITTLVSLVHVLRISLHEMFGSFAGKRDTPLLSRVWGLWSATRSRGQDRLVKIERIHRQRMRDPHAESWSLRCT